MKKKINTTYVRMFEVPFFSSIFFPRKIAAICSPNYQVVLCHKYLFRVYYGPGPVPSDFIRLSHVILIEALGNNSTYLRYRILSW